MKALKPLN
jgi:hypothetical protein